MNPKFNFDEMKALYQRSPEVFEQRRIELINAAIDRCSGPQQIALRALQHQLDEQRNKRPAHFLETCFSWMQVSLKDLPPLWARLSAAAKKLADSN